MVLKQLLTGTDRYVAAAFAKWFMIALKFFIMLCN